MDGHRPINHFCQKGNLLRLLPIDKVTGEKDAGKNMREYSHSIH